MKIGERGQVTIPKEIREEFGLGPATEVQFHVIRGSIVLKKSTQKAWPLQMERPLGRHVCEAGLHLRGQVY